MSPTTTVQTTETTVLINLNNAGIQGATGTNAVVAVTSPITNSGTSSSATIGLNQNLLSLTKSQISDFTSGTVASAGFATTSGTAVYATTSGTSVSISGSITRSQVSDYATGTVANISGTVTQSQVSGLATTLTGYAALGSANTFTVGGQIVTSTSDTVMPLVLRRASATATASILEFQTSTGTAIASVDASARGNFPAVSAGASTALGYGALSVNTGAVGTKGISVQGVTSQSANLFEAIGSNTVTVTGAGLLVSDASIQATGIRNPSVVTVLGFNTAGINVLNNTSAATAIGLVVRGAASQSANLQQWQNSGGTALAKVDASGNVFGAVIAGLNSLVFLREESSGGLFEAKKLTAAASNPGSNNGKIYFRDGTTGGTLKLVVRAGTAGAETTILDNIPT